MAAKLTTPLGDLSAGNDVSTASSGDGLLIGGRLIPWHEIDGIVVTKKRGKSTSAYGDFSSIADSPEAAALIASVGAGLLIGWSGDEQPIGLDFSTSADEAQRLANSYARIRKLRQGRYEPSLIRSAPGEATGSASRADLKEKFQKQLADQLLDDEQILAHAQSRVGEAIVATNKRVFILMRGVMAGQMLGQRKSRSWMYPQIANVEFNIGVTQGYIEIQSAGGTVAHAKDREDNLIRFPKTDKYLDAFRTVYRVIQEQISASHRPQLVTARSEPTEPDVLDQLKKLGELRDAGVLTDSEFDEKKKALLERL